MINKIEGLDVGTAANTFGLVLFPHYPNPASLFPPIRSLDRGEVIRLITTGNPPYASRQIDPYDHFVTPEEAAAVSVTLKHIGVIRRAVVSFAGLFLLSNQFDREEFIRSAPDKPLAGYSGYQEFLRAALRTFVVEAEAIGSEEDPLLDVFIRNFSPLATDRLFGGESYGILDQNGNSSLEIQLFSRLPK